MSCPDCFKGAVRSHAKPTGRIETIHGIRTYIAGTGKDDENGAMRPKSPSCIIYLPDAFSLRLVNNKLLADQYSSLTGCRVLIPDVVHGGGMDPAILPRMETATSPMDKVTLTGILRKAGAFAALLPAFIPFMVQGAPEKVYDKILAYARLIKAELPPSGKLGVIGFCWGGWISTKLCSEATILGGDKPLVDAHFHGHPSSIHKTPEMVVEAITKYAVPFAAAIAENDFQFNEQVAKQTEAMVEASIRTRASGQAGNGGRFVYEFKIYPGCVHGFCVRAQENTANMRGSEEALKQGTDWFIKYLS